MKSATHDVFHRCDIYLLPPDNAHTLLRELLKKRLTRLCVMWYL